MFLSFCLTDIIMASNQIFFASVLLICSSCINAKNFTCYQCYYSIEHLKEEWNRPECMDSPARPGVGVVYPCREDFYCFVQETYDLQTQQVVEYKRSCVAVGYETSCTKDTYHVICRKSCRGELCTKNITALHDIYFNRSGKLFDVRYFSLYCMLSILVLLIVT